MKMPQDETEKHKRREGNIHLKTSKTLLSQIQKE